MFRLEFSTDSAAFTDPDGNHAQAKALETGRILGLLRSKVLASMIEGKIIDYNGNIIGKWSLTKGDNK